MDFSKHTLTSNFPSITDFMFTLMTKLTSFLLTPVLITYLNFCSIDFHYLMHLPVYCLYIKSIYQSKTYQFHPILSLNYLERLSFCFFFFF